VYVPFENPVTVQPSCVQTAVTALNVTSAVRATRIFRLDVWTKAALPTLFSGEFASIVNLIVPAETVAEIVAIPDADPPGEGSDGFSQLLSSAMSASAEITSEPSLIVSATNSLRVCGMLFPAPSFNIIRKEF
jgi:hypothetical protein